MQRVAISAMAGGLIVGWMGMAAAQHHSHDSGQHQLERPRAPGEASGDTRIEVALPPMMANHMLANMRDHLAALQEISQALSSGENEKAAKIAENRLGMSSLEAHGADHMAKFMPKGMQDAGTAMHRAASRLAIQAQNVGATGDMKPAIAALSDVMSACVGCHAGYRIR